MPATTIPTTTGAGHLEAYLSSPTVGDGPWPGVVVIHELFGLNDDIHQQTDHLAAAGYLAVAPNLYTNGGMVRCLRSVFAALQAGKGPAVDDIDAVRTWMADRSDCTGKVGVIGFCMGGGFALVTASRGFDAAAPNYGVLPPRADEVLAGACPIVASYGKRDPMLPGTAKKLEEVLTRVGVEHDVKRYPGAGHSFLNRHSAGALTGPLSVLEKVAGFSYHQPSAEDAWARILNFFERHLH